jgi:hypothetical protein
MTDHPITPPPELVQEWYDQAKQDPCGPINWIATRAAQWGADCELDACCDALNDINDSRYWSGQLRAARRPSPKPPSLRQQALAAWHGIASGGDNTKEWYEDLDTIRRALEALPND